MQNQMAIAMLIAVSVLAGVQGRSVVEANAGNTCPDGYDKITSVAACVAALDIIGPGSYESHGWSAFPAHDFQGAENESDFPSGCYYCYEVPGCTDGIWFNHHPIGTAKGNAIPICATGLEPLTMGGVLWMGDSDTDYWPGTATLAPGSYNVAVGGHTCTNVEAELPYYLPIFQPRVVVLTCGENDLFDVSVEEAFAAFQRVVTAINAHGARVIHMGTKAEPADSVQDLHDDYEILDAKIQDLAKSLANDPPILTAVDVHTGFMALGNPDSLYAEDKLHLSSSAYALWDQWVAQALADPTCAIWSNGNCVLVAIHNTPYTCGDIKAAYRDSACCGMPEKMFAFPNKRRLSSTNGMNEHEYLLSQIRAAMETKKKWHGQKGVHELTKEIRQAILQST